MVTVNTHWNVDFSFDAADFRWSGSYTATNKVVSFVYDDPGSPLDGLGISFFGDFVLDSGRVIGGTFDSAEIRNPSGELIENWTNAGIDFDESDLSGSTIVELLMKGADDLIISSNFDDVLRGGGGGADTYYLGTTGGSDEIYLSSHIFGLSHLLDYSGYSRPSLQGIEVDLPNGRVYHLGTSEIGDRIYGLPDSIDITATGYDDRIRHDFLGGRIIAGDGNDWVSGGGGGDDIDGRAGTDTVDYSWINSSSQDRPIEGGLRIVLVPSDVPISGFARYETLNGTEWVQIEDQLNGIENVIGSSFADRIEGHRESNTLLGEGGNDRLLGRGGDDLFDGGAGVDVLSYEWMTAGLGTITVRAATGNQGTVVHTGNDAGTDTFNRMEELVGTAGADDVDLLGMTGIRLTDGAGGNDTLRGTRGNETLLGGDGDDLIEGRGGGDTMRSGNGNDTFRLTSANLPVDFGRNDVYDGGAGFDTISIQATSPSQFDFRLADVASVEALVFAGTENMSALFQSNKVGGAGLSANLVVTGNANHNRLYVVLVTTTLDLSGWTFNNWGGTDVVEIGASDVADTITGSRVNDLIIGAFGNDMINGGAGDDAIAGNNDRDTLLGGDGNDILFGGADVDVLFGQGGNDTLWGEDNTGAGAATDGIDGGDGNDTILGQGGADNLLGGNGADAIAGGADGDSIQGQAGNDVVFGGSGADAISGQDGNDVLWGEDNDPGTAGGADGIDGGAGDDTILGQGGNDFLVGGDGFDAIAGGDGIDWMYGQNGADVIFGGAGNDLIYGGFGGDVLRGDAGGDLFVYHVGDAGDLILGFNEGGVRDGFDLRPLFDATGYTGNTPRAAGILSVRQSGADTDVYVYNAFLFRIQGVVAAAIDDSYFLFQ